MPKVPRDGIVGGKVGGRGRATKPSPGSGSGWGRKASGDRDPGGEGKTTGSFLVGVGGEDIGSKAGSEAEPP